MARKAYVGINTQVPVYEGSTILLNTGTLLQEKFSFGGVDEWVVNDFALDETTGIFTSNNAGSYYETEYEDEETGETLYEEEGEDAWMSLHPKAQITNLYIDWKVSSEKDYDIFYIYHNDITLVEASGEQSGTIGPLTLATSDYLSFGYTKDSSNDVGDDMATISNIRIDSKVQTGTEIKPVARNVNNIYLGINNIAQSITKAYIGIGGVARPFWGHTITDIQLYGTVTPLPTGKEHHAAGQNSAYALLAEGDIHNLKPIQYMLMMQI